MGLCVWKTIRACHVPSVKVSADSIIFRLRESADKSMIETRQNIKRWDYLLICGTCLAPMTGLRVWKIGPAELLCFLWCLKGISFRIYHKRELYLFFRTFLFSMLMGTFICILVSPAELARGDWATWLFLTFVALSLYEKLSLNKLSYNEKLLYTISVLSSFWYLFLYYYSLKISRSFLGVPLWFRGVRFAGGGNNPHQLAVLMCGIFFGLARRIVIQPRNIVCWVAMSGSAFLVYQTASSTGMLSLFSGLLALIIILSITSSRSKKTRIIVAFFELFIGILVIAILYDRIYGLTYNWIASDKNGLGRLAIFSEIGKAFVKSPIFGLGPGAHSNDGYMPKEFHNTYLEILAATGIVGSISFIKLTTSTVKKLFADPMLIPILVAMYTYGLAGFAMRRLAYWVLFVFILVLSEKILNKEGNNV